MPDADSEQPARRALSTDGASKPLARYSQGIAAAGLVLTAGKGAHDPVTGALPDGIEAMNAAFDHCMPEVPAVRTTMQARRGLTPLRWRGRPGRP